MLGLLALMLSVLGTWWFPASSEARPTRGDWARDTKVETIVPMSITLIRAREDAWILHTLGAADFPIVR